MKNPYWGADEDDHYPTTEEIAIVLALATVCGVLTLVISIII